MGLEERLVAVLTERFAGAVAERSAEDEPQIRFPAADPEVGDAIAVVEHDEVTMYVGEIAHGHFKRFDLEPQERDEAIVDGVVMFLEDLFADRVLLWCDGFGGGWRVLDPGEPPRPRGTRSFLWSGPLPDRSD